jgi:hypothetical protein
MRSSGEGFEVSGTIGQPDATVLSGGEFILTGGFWFQIPPMDCNDDGYTNLLDHADVVQCLSGPSGGYASAKCRCFDIDKDNDIDLTDLHRFQTTFLAG